MIKLCVLTDVIDIFISINIRHTLKKIIVPKIISLNWNFNNVTNAVLTV